MRRFIKKILPVMTLAIIPACAGLVLAQPGRRPDLPAPPPKPPIGGTPRPFASITITVDPADSTVWLNDQHNQKPYQASPNGELIIPKLSPGSYTITVRRQGYQDYQNTLKLVKGKNPPLVLKLEPLPGKLTVSPSVKNAQITVRNVADTQATKSSAGSMEDVELPPGKYEVAVSKSGYQTAIKMITITAGGTVYLEPTLEPLPIETPEPTPLPTSTRQRRFAPMSSLVAKEDKYLVVSMRGNSDDQSTAMGSINVAIGSVASLSALVNGTLNGFPCQVEFIRLENVADGSLVETPSPSNQWSLVVVRVRPKDPKRPIHFAINWKSLPGSPSATSDPQAANFVEAVAIQKVLPSFPTAARNSPIGGSVSVSVAIDRDGRVVSAKAIDGPSVFRHAAEDAVRKWKFRPATRNGQSVESVQLIRFVFEK